MTDRRRDSVTAARREGKGLPRQLLDARHSDVRRRSTWNGAGGRARVTRIVSKVAKGRQLATFDHRLEILAFRAKCASGRQLHVPLPLDWLCYGISSTG